MRRFARTALLISTGAALAGTATVAGASEFSEWAARHRGEFQAFKDARDAEFHGFLTRHWQQFDAFADAQRDGTLKPAAMPRALPEAQPERAELIEPEPAAVPPAPPAREVAAERPQPSQPPVAPVSGQPVTVAFLGHDLRLAVPAGLSGLRLRRADNQGVADFWRDFAQFEVRPLLAEVDRQADALGLNGWGRLSLLNRLAQALPGADAKTAATLTWALALRAGLDVRLGYGADRIVLLFRAEEPLFEVPYFELSERRYYQFAPGDGAIEGGKAPLYIYTGDHAEASRGVAVTLEHSPVASAEVRRRELSFEFEGKRHRFTVEYEPALAEFLGGMPQLDLPQYFVGSPGPKLRDSLVAGLAPLVEGMEPARAANLLLRFAQTAFDYQTDEQQFGRENYLFPLETVAFPYSDCEDRSIFYAWLVHELLGLKVVALDYPGHVATAVDVALQGPATRIEVDGRGWVVADPTYINANLGMLNPGFRGQKPRVVPVRFASAR